MHKSLIYEMHVRGFTMRHPDIPEHLRGTYAAMHRTLLELVVREAGSIRKAAARLAVPRSTLCAWLKADPA